MAKVMRYSVMVYVDSPLISDYFEDMGGEHTAKDIERMMLKALRCFDLDTDLEVLGSELVDENEGYPLGRKGVK